MNHYTNRPEGFGEIRRQLLLRGLPLGLLALGVGYGMSYANSESTPQQEAEVLLLLIPLMLGALGVGIYRSIQQQKRLYHSYTLTISDTSITREISDTPSITIPLARITRITRHHNGSLTITGATAHEVIGIHKQIEDYDALEAQLRALHPVTPQLRMPMLERLRIPLVVATLGLMVMVYVATNKILVATSGAALSGLLLWSFFYIQRSPQLDYATKRRSWWVLLVVFSILATTVVKLLTE
ncbi:hypothetical protein [Hymenobacter sp. UYP22]|uniref:hypothetical protein n=1 Tax=Hymenobacter sp. UYP22 TaxID=3156348 RepID=UPI0033987923